MMRLRPLAFLSVAILSSAPALHGATITKTRIVNPDGRSRTRGDLYVTVDGKERRLADLAHKAWIIEDGAAVVCAEDGGNERDFHTEILWRYDVNGSRQGKFTPLMGRFTEIDNLRVSHSRSGKAALIVSGTADGSGAPTAAIVHPRRGMVWSQYNSRVVGLRNGRAVIAVFNPEEGDEPTDRPIRVLYLDLDQMLKRPAKPNN